MKPFTTNYYPEEGQSPFVAPAIWAVVVGATLAACGFDRESWAAANGVAFLIVTLMGGFIDANLLGAGMMLMLGFRALTHLFPALDLGSAALSMGLANMALLAIYFGIGRVFKLLHLVVVLAFLGMQLGVVAYLDRQAPIGKGVCMGLLFILVSLVLHKFTRATPQPKDPNEVEDPLDL
jgi:hypothetical protein